mgnify:CR=1 FL=1
MVGFITIDRRILKWEWYSDPNTFRVFIHLLLNANHADNKHRGILIKRGQTLTGRKKMATELGLTEMKIRTALFKLKRTGEITIKSTTNESIITICKYDNYQDKSKKNNQQNNHKFNQRNNQQITNGITTNNKDNNENNNNLIVKQKEKSEKNETAAIVEMPPASGVGILLAKVKGAGG